MCPNLPDVGIYPTLPYMLYLSKSHFCLVCEPLSPPANGIISTTDNDTVSMFSCNMGYTLNGNDTRVCLMDGTAWSGIPPSCGMYAQIYYSEIVFYLHN